MMRNNNKKNKNRKGGDKIIKINLKKKMGSNASEKSSQHQQSLNKSQLSQMQQTARKSMSINTAMYKEFGIETVAPETKRD